MKELNFLKDQYSHHIKTSQLICGQNEPMLYVGKFFNSEKELIFKNSTYPDNLTNDCFRTIGKDFYLNFLHYSQLNLNSYHVLFSFFFQ